MKEERKKGLSKKTLKLQYNSEKSLNSANGIFLIKTPQGKVPSQTGVSNPSTSLYSATG